MKTTFILLGLLIHFQCLAIDWNHECPKQILPIEDFDHCLKTATSLVSGFPDGATWYYSPASTTFAEKVWKVQVLQDTIIDDQVYKILAIDKGQGIIEESKIPINLVNNKMMFYENGKSHLLYDFDAKLGDTIQYKIPSLAYFYDITFNEGTTKPVLPTYQLIIEKVDTIFSSEGKMLKKFGVRSLQGSNEFEHGLFDIVENIGSSAHGFFGSFGPYISIDKQGYFRCFQSTDLNYSNINRECVPKVLDSLLPILDTNLIRYVVIRDFFSPQTKMERWRFASTPTLLDAGQEYFELLISDEKDGTNFTGTDRYFRERDNRFYQYLSPLAGELTLYDMNLNLGDSIKISYTDGLRNLIVTKVDSISLLDQIIRKRLTLQCLINGELDSGEPVVWIEGIGRLFEPFVDYSPCSILDIARPEVVCIYNEFERLYKNDTAPDDCWIISPAIDTTAMDITTIWYSSSYKGDFADGGCSQKIDITKVMRDTLIDNRLCRIIGVTSDGIYLPESEIVVFSKENKMYFYEDNVWKILYNFDANVGDTITYYISKKYPYFSPYSLLQPFEQYIIDNNPFKLVIKQVDSIVSTNGVSLKKFVTKNVFNQAGHFMDTIIQHVGSKYKLFGNNGFITPPECFGSLPSLRCYSDDDISIKFTEGLCDKLTSVNEVLQGAMKIYPNPVLNQIYIQQKELVGIVVYDFQGKKIVNLDVDANLELQTINLGHLSMGQYFLISTDQNGRLWYNRFQKL